jgi:hypothetical protein
MSKRLIGIGFIATIMAILVLGKPPAPNVDAAANTTGLKSLNLRGVGVGSLATGVTTCGTQVCIPSSTCNCLTGSETVLGNNFNNGSLVFNLLVDTTAADLSPIPSTCSPAQGTAILSAKKGKQSLTMNVSGQACPTLDTTTPVDVFNGTYVVVNGSGKYSASSGGTGAINGSQSGATGLSQAVLTGSVQKVAPLAVGSPVSSASASPTESPTASPTESPTASPTASASPAAS